MQKLSAQKHQLHGVSLPTPDSATQSERVVRPSVKLIFRMFADRRHKRCR
jgi:hypothetical protein